MTLSCLRYLADIIYGRPRLFVDIIDLVLVGSRDLVLVGSGDLVLVGP